MKKARLNELFSGITQSRQRVNKITEMGCFWRISFEDRQLGDLDIIGRKSADIAKEISKHTGVAK